MKDIKKDFESFASDPSPKAPSAILNRIQTQLEKELPSPWKAARGLGLAHLGSSFLTLMACSQFGVRLFFDGEGLMHYFMKISPTFCMSFCGALYLATTVLLARLFLTHDEWNLILRSRGLSIASLALISLGGFSLVSHEVNFETGLLWFFGAALGGELVTYVKSPHLWFSHTSLRK